MRKFILSSAWSREKAKQTIDVAPNGYVVTVGEQTRTLAQNDRLWAMLTDVSVSMPMGRRHTPDDWKAIFMNALNWECQFCEGLDGRPFPIGFRSSKLSKSQMAELITYIQAFGDENGVRWTDQQDEAA